MPAAALAIAVACLADPAAAQPRALYAVTGAGATPSTLYLLDARDGSVIREIGPIESDPIGVADVTDIAFHPVTGALYGVVSNGDLISIDPETGSSLAIGPHGSTVPDLAFAPSGILYGWTESSDDLARLDVGTGALTVVGDCGVSTQQTGIAVDRDGTAFMKHDSNVYTVDRLTGACTQLATLGVGTLDDILAIDDRGTFYGADRTGSGADIYTVDPSTGVATKIGSNSLANLSGLAFRPPPLEPLYAIDGAGGNAATLYRLDPRNGALLQTIGPVGFSHLTSLAFHPVTGVLYGATAGSGGGTSELITIDVETGAGTAVGPLGIDFGPPDIGFAPSGVLYAWTEDTDDLTTVDLTTGAATPVGECGEGTARTGIAVDAAGRAWMKSGDILYRVDRTSGACTAPLAIAGAGSLDNVLVFNGSSTLYSADRQGGATEIRTVDPVTGDAIPVGTNAIAGLSDIAFRPHPLPPLYATDGGGGGGGDGTGAISTLYRLDPRNGSVVQAIGPVGFNEVVGLAFHPVTGVLYGTSNGGAGQLIEIDPKTGAGTAVGSTGAQIPDISFAPSGALYGWIEEPDGLAQINLATGAATSVGPCGESTSATGFAIDVTGNARVKPGNALHSVDRVTGACGAALPLTGTGSLRSALAYAPGGILYSLDRPVGGSRLYTVDAQTGTMNFVGANAIANLASLAFEPVRPTSLYAADGAGDTPSHLYLLDPDDGSVVANLGPIGLSGVNGLDFHPPAGFLLGAKEDLAFSLDPETAAVIGSVPIDVTVSDLGAAPSGRFYLWDETTDDLVKLDPQTGQFSTVGECGVATSETGFAVDEQGTAFMKTGVSPSLLYQVDRVTGACTFVKSIAGSSRDELAFDDVGRLYTFDRSGGTAQLFRVNVAAGTLSSIGTNDLGTLSALAFQPLPHRPFYAVSGGESPKLYRLDGRNGGVIRNVGDTIGQAESIAFQPGTGVLFGASVSNLFTIDRNTAAGSLVGFHGLDDMPDMSFSPDGKLYGLFPIGSSLVRLDTTNGAPTAIGTCSASLDSAGLAVDQFFNAYLNSGPNLYSVNLATGACTLQTAITGDELGPGGALDAGLTFSDRGTLFGLKSVPENNLTLIFAVDPQTGEAFVHGTTNVPDLISIEFMPEPARATAVGVGAAAVALLAAWRSRREIRPRP